MSKLCCGAMLLCAALLAMPAAAVSDTTVIVEWSNQAVSLGRAASGVAIANGRLELTFLSSRTRALLHLAQHDALNAIAPRYQCYVMPCGSAPLADPTAALAQASHDVLLSQHPEARKQLDALLAAQLARVPASAAQSAGILAGQRAARSVMRARRNDGWYASGDYSFGTLPGEYQTTPHWKGYVMHPALRHARPFALQAPGQFRPGPPPALASGEYMRAFDEVKHQGRADSTARTADQTGYAVWWMDDADFSIHPLAERLAIEQQLSSHETARLLATMSLALADTYVAVWDSKFEFNHWRPYTAIRAAGNDGNPATTADESWEPLRPTPPMPDYVSAHSAACSSTLTVLERVFGDRTAFTMSSGTAPPGMPTRSFTRFSAAAAECADSRVQLGFHFRYATNAGLALGRKIANHVYDQHLRPVPMRKPHARDRG